MCDHVPFREAEPASYCSQEGIEPRSLDLQTFQEQGQLHMAFHLPHPGAQGSQCQGEETRTPQPFEASQQVRDLPLL